jgi:chromosome segregation ATPase
MNRSSLLFVGLLLFAVACFGQTSASDSQTLQALLTEVRQLRQDLRTTTLAAQRSQILLYRLRDQEAAVDRASQRLDEARRVLAKTRDERKFAAANIKQNEDFAANMDKPEEQRKSAENMLAEFRTRLQSLDSDEQQYQSREIEAEQQLRDEEVRLSDLRNQLDRLDKTLEDAGRRTDSGSQ